MGQKVETTKEQRKGQPGGDPTIGSTRHEDTSALPGMKTKRFGGTSNILNEQSQDFIPQQMCENPACF